MLPSVTGDSGEGPTALPLSDETSFLLARLNALSLTATNAALASLKLRARSYSVLALAAGPTRMSQRDLASYLRLDPSQVVALVDDLEQRGLVQRVAVLSDRRTNAVVATDAGESLASRAYVRLREAEADLFRALDTEERATLAALLRRVAFTD